MNVSVDAHVKPGEHTVVVTHLNTGYVCLNIGEIALYFKNINHLESFGLQLAENISRIKGKK